MRSCIRPIPGVALLNSMDDTTAARTCRDQTERWLEMHKRHPSRSNLIALSWWASMRDEYQAIIAERVTTEIAPPKRTARWARNLVKGVSRG